MRSSSALLRVTSYASRMALQRRQRQGVASAMPHLSNLSKGCTAHGASEPAASQGWRSGEPSRGIHTAECTHAACCTWPVHGPQAGMANRQHGPKNPCDATLVSLKCLLSGAPPSVNTLSRHFATGWCRRLAPRLPDRPPLSWQRPPASPTQQAQQRDHCSLAGPRRSSPVFHLLGRPHGQRSLHKVGPLLWQERLTCRWQWGSVSAWMPSNSLPRCRQPASQLAQPTTLPAADAPA